MVKLNNCLKKMWAPKFGKPTFLRWRSLWIAVSFLVSFEPIQTAKCFRAEKERCKTSFLILRYLKSQQEMHKRFAGLAQRICHVVLCGCSSALAQTAWGLGKMNRHSGQTEASHIFGRGSNYGN